MPDATWWTGVFLPWFILFAVIYVFLDVLYTLSVSITHIFSLDDTVVSDSNTVYEDSIFIEKFLSNLPLEEKRRVKITEPLSLNAVFSYNNDEFRRIGLYKRSIQNDLVAKIKTELQSRKSYREFKQQRGVVYLSKIFDSFLSLVVSGFSLLIFMLYFLAPLIAIFGFVYVFYLYYPWVLGNSVLLWNQQIGPVWDESVAILFNLLETLFSAYVAVYNLVVWSVINAPLKVLAMMMTDGFEDVKDFGNNGLSFFRQTFTDVQSFVSTLNDYGSCVDVDDPKCYQTVPLNIERGMVHGRLAISSAVRFFGRSCTIISPALNIIVYPLLDPNTGLAIQALFESITSTIQSIMLTQRRSRIPEIASWFRLPDLEPTFNALVTASTHIGYTLDNWLDMTYFLSWQYYNPQDITSCLNDRRYLNILFGTNHSALFGRRQVTIVSLTPELFAFTDGFNVEYHLYKQNLKIYESYNAWDIPINVSYGVAAVSYATNTFQDEFASGETTSMLGCQCTDNVTSGRMEILCNIATYDPSGQVSGLKLVPVEWEVKNTPLRMSCSQTKIQVESVRWPTRRFTKPYDFDLYTISGRPPPLNCYDTQTCTSVDAVIWIMPLCDTGSSAVTPLLKSSCISNFIDFSCFPYCFALRTKNSGTEKLIIRSSKTWESNVFLQNRDCVLSEIDQSDKGSVSSLYKITKFGDITSDGLRTVQYVDYPYEDYEVNQIGITSTPSCVFSSSAISRIPRQDLDDYNQFLNNTQQISDMMELYSYQESASVYFNSAVNFIKLNLQPLVFGGSMGMRRIEICENPDEKTQCELPSCDVSCDSSIDFFRISGNEFNEFTLDYLMQGGIPLVELATPSQASNIMTSSSLLPPPSSLESAFIDNPGVSTFDKFWYAVNPNYRSIECVARFCLLGGEVNCFQNIINSDLDPIRVWRVNPYVNCPVNVNGDKQCPVGTFSSVYLNRSRSIFKDLQVDQSLCFQNDTKDLFVEHMEYFDELNVIAVVRRGTIQDLYRVLWTEGGDPSPAFKNTPLEFRQYVQNRLETVYYFINTDTMEISENVPWMVVPTSADTELPICPQFRGMPRLGSLVAELNNAVLHLVKKTVNLLLNSPSLIVIWSTPKTDRCQIPSYGHSIFSNCGRDYFDIEPFFGSLYRANTHLWSTLMWASNIIPSGLSWPVSETGIFIRQFLQGMAVYGENTKYIIGNDLTNAFVVTTDSQMQDLVFENMGSDSSSFTGMTFNLVSVKTAIGMHVSVTPVAYAHAMYIVIYPIFDEIFSSFYQGLLGTQPGIGMFMNNIFYSNRLKIMDIIFIRHEQACYGISLMTGMNTPLGELMLKWCLAGVEFQRSVLDLFFSVFVELPSMNCVCTRAQGGDLITVLFGDDEFLGCLETAATEFKPLIMNMLYIDEVNNGLGVYNGGASSTLALSQICNGLKEYTLVRFFETFNVWAEHSYQAANALADTVEYLTVFFFSVYSGGSFLQRQKTCVNYVSNPFVAVIYPMPLDYFRICGKTSVCTAKCSAEKNLLDEEIRQLGGMSNSLVSPTTTNARIASPIFTTWDEYYNLDIYPLSISEMNPIDEACSGCNNDVNSMERCFAVVGVPVQTAANNGYLINDGIVKIFCIPKSLQKTIHMSHAWTLSTPTHTTKEFTMIDDENERRIMRASFSKPYSHYVLTLLQQNVPMITSSSSSTKENIVAWTYSVVSGKQRSRTIASNDWINLECSGQILDDIEIESSVPLEQIERQILYVKITDFFTLPSRRYDISIVAFLKVNVRQYQVRPINGESFVYEQSESDAFVHIGWCDLDTSRSDKIECQKSSRVETTCERLDRNNIMQLKAKMESGNLIYTPESTQYLWLPIYTASTRMMHIQNITFTENSVDILRFYFNNTNTVWPLSINDKGTRMLLTSHNYFDTVALQSNVKYYSYTMTNRISETSAWITEDGDTLPSWLLINTRLSRGPWLEITDYDKEMTVLTSRNTEVIIAKITRQYQCDGNTCEGCDTTKSLKLKTLCSAMQSCVFKNCIGTLINTGNLFCNVGLTLKSYYESVVSMLLSLWYTLSESVTLVIQNQYLPAGSSVSIKINWPTDVVYIFICETKDVIAQATSIIASLINLNVSPQNYADMELMSRGYTTFQSYTSLRASSIHQIFYHMGLFPLYLIQALHKWAICTTNDFVNVFENDIFRLEIGDVSTLKVGVNSDDPYAPGICLSQYYAELGLSSENNNEVGFANSVAQEFSSLNGITSFAGSLILNNFGTYSMSNDLSKFQSSTSNQQSILQTKAFFLQKQLDEINNPMNNPIDATLNRKPKDNKMFFSRAKELVEAPIRLYTNVKMYSKDFYQKGRRTAKFVSRVTLTSMFSSVAKFGGRVGLASLTKLSSLGPIELLIHGFDSFFAWSKGVNTAFQDLAYVEEMSYCQASDVTTPSIIRCACNDEAVLMQEDKRKLTWENFGFFCSGTLLMPLKNEKVAIIFNPYSMDQLSSLLYHSIVDYLDCLKRLNTEDDLDCSINEPNIPVFSEQDVSSMAVWTRCKSNYAAMQWDEGTKALFSDEAPFAASNQITINSIRSERGRAIAAASSFSPELLSCLQDVSSTPNLVSECLDIYLRYFQPPNIGNREGVRKPTYFAYTVENNPKQEADACKLFSGPASSELSHIQEIYRPCVDDTDGTQCKVNMVAWIGSTTNKVPIGAVHREIIPRDAEYRAELVNTKYQQIKERVEVAFKQYEETAARDLEAIDVSVFSAEGDMIHQMFDCVFMGPYSNVDFLAGDGEVDRVLQTLPWNRDGIGSTRDFTLPCAGGILRETPENRGAPFTCGSPSRRSIIKNFVREVLIKNTTAEGHVRKLVNEKIEQLNRAWTNVDLYGCYDVSTDTTSYLNCEDPLFKGDALGYEPNLPNFGQISSDVIAAYINDLIEPYYKTVMTSTHPWNRYYKDSEQKTLWGQWRTDEGSFAVAERIHAFDTQSFIVSYNGTENYQNVDHSHVSEAMKTLDMRRDELAHSIWGVCTGMLSQVMLTTPVIKYNDSEETWSPRFTREAGNSFDPNVENIDTWVERFLEESFLNSPLYSTHVGRHVPSFSKFCIEDSKSFHELDDRATDVPIVPLHIISNQFNSTPTDETLVGTPKNEHFLFYGFDSWSVNEIFERCPCSTKNVTEMTCTISPENCDIISQTLLLLGESSSDQYKSNSFLNEICNQGAGVFQSQMIRNVLTAMFTSKAPLHCPEMRPSDLWGFVDEDSLVDQEVEYTEIFKPEVNESNIEIPVCPCSVEFQSPIIIYNYTESENETAILIDVVDTGQKRDYCRLNQDVCDTVMSIWGNENRESILYPDINALYVICLNNRTYEASRSSDVFRHIQWYRLSTTCVTLLPEYKIVNETKKSLNSAKWRNKGFLPQSNFVIEGRAGIKINNYRIVNDTFHALINPSSRFLNISNIQTFAQDKCFDVNQVQDADIASRFDEIVFNFFPVIQGVHESLAYSTCTRYAIELARNRFYENIGYFDINKHEDIFVLWRDRCEHKIKQMSICHLHNVFDIVPDHWELLSHDCPFDVIRLKTLADQHAYPTRLYVTGGCLVYLNGTFYDGIRCFTGSASNFSNGLLDVTSSPPGCIVDTRLLTSGDNLIEQVDLDVGMLNNELSDFKEVWNQLKNNDTLSYIPYDITMDFLTDVFETSTNLRKDNAPKSNCITGGNQLFCQQSLHCDKIIDWWPEDWKYPIGYHVTMPCEMHNTAHKTFDSHYAAFENKNEDNWSYESFHYVHGAFRDNKRFFSHFGASGLCRIPTVGMPLIETNTNRVCTKEKIKSIIATPQLYTGEFDNSQSFIESEYENTEHCSTDSSQVPWSYTNSNDVLNNVAGSIPLMLALTKSDPLDVTLRRFLDLCFPPSGNEGINCVEYNNEISELVFQLLPFAGIIDVDKEREADWAGCLPEWGFGKSCSVNDTICPTHTTCNVHDDVNNGRCISKAELVYENPSNGYKSIPCITDEDCLQEDHECLINGVCGIRIHKNKKACTTSNSCPETQFCLADGYCGHMHFHFMNIYDDRSVEFSVLAQDCGYTSPGVEQVSSRSSPYGIIPDILQKHGMCSHRHWYSYRKAVNMLYHQSEDASKQESYIDYLDPSHSWPFIQRDGQNMPLNSPNGHVPINDTLLQMYPHPCDQLYLHDTDMKVCSSFTGFDDRISLSNNEVYGIDVVKNNAIFKGYQIQRNNKLISKFERDEWFTYWPRTSTKNDKNIAVLFNGLLHDQEKELYQSGQFNDIKPSPMGFVGGDPYASDDTLAKKLNNNQINFRRCMDLPYCGIPDFTVQGLAVNSRLVLKDIFQNSGETFREYNETDMRLCFSIGYIVVINNFEYCAVDGMSTPLLMTIVKSETTMNECQEIIGGVFDFVQNLDKFESLPSPAQLDVNKLYCYGEFVSLGLPLCLFTPGLVEAQFSTLATKINKLSNFFDFSIAAFKSSSSESKYIKICRCTERTRDTIYSFFERFQLWNHYQNSTDILPADRRISAMYHVLSYHTYEYPLLWWVKYTLQINVIQTFITRTNQFIDIGNIWTRRFNSDELHECNLNGGKQWINYIGCINGFPLSASSEMRIDIADFNANLKQYYREFFLEELRKNNELSTYLNATPSYYEKIKGNVRQMFQNNIDRQYSSIFEFIQRVMMDLYKNPSNIDRAKDDLLGLFNNIENEVVPKLFFADTSSEVTIPDLEKTLNKKISRFVRCIEGIKPNERWLREIKNGFQAPVYYIDYDDIEDCVSRNILETKNVGSLDVMPQDECSFPAEESIFEFNEYEHSRHRDAWTVDGPVVNFMFDDGVCSLDSGPKRCNQRPGYKLDVCNNQQGISSVYGKNFVPLKKFNLLDDGFDTCENSPDCTYPRSNEMLRELRKTKKYMFCKNYSLSCQKSCNSNRVCDTIEFTQDQERGCFVYNSLIYSVSIDGKQYVGCETRSPTATCHIKIDKPVYNDLKGLYNFDIFSDKEPSARGEFYPFQGGYSFCEANTKEMHTTECVESCRPVPSILLRSTDYMASKPHADQTLEHEFLCGKLFKTKKKPSEFLREHNFPENSDKGAFDNFVRDSYRAINTDNDINNAAGFFSSKTDTLHTCHIRQAVMPPGVAAKFYTLDKKEEDIAEHLLSVQDQEFPLWTNCPIPDFEDANVNIPDDEISFTMPQKSKGKFYGNNASVDHTKLVTDLSGTGYEKIWSTNSWRFTSTTTTTETSVYSTCDPEKDSPCMGACHYALALSKNAQCATSVPEFVDKMRARSRKGKGVDSCNNGKRIFKMTNIREKDKFDMYQCRNCITLRDLSFSGRFLHFYKSDSSTISQDDVHNTIRHISNSIYTNETIFKTLIDYINSKLFIEDDVFENKQSFVTPDIYVNMKKFSFTDDFLHWGVPDQNHVCKTSSLSNSNDLVEDINLKCSFLTFNLTIVNDRDNYYINNPTALNCPSEMPTAYDYRRCGDDIYGNSRKKLASFVTDVYKKRNGLWMHVIPPMTAVKWRENRRRVNGRFSMFFSEAERPLVQRYSDYIFSDDICNLGKKEISMCILYNNKNYVANPWIGGEWHVYMQADVCERGGVNTREICCSCSPSAECCYPDKRYCSNEDNIMDYLFEKENSLIIDQSTASSTCSIANSRYSVADEVSKEDYIMDFNPIDVCKLKPLLPNTCQHNQGILGGANPSVNRQVSYEEMQRGADINTGTHKIISRQNSIWTGGSFLLESIETSSELVSSYLSMDGLCLFPAHVVYGLSRQRQNISKKDNMVLRVHSMQFIENGGELKPEFDTFDTGSFINIMDTFRDETQIIQRLYPQLNSSAISDTSRFKENNPHAWGCPFRKIDFWSKNFSGFGPLYPDPVRTNEFFGNCSCDESTSTCFPGVHPMQKPQPVTHLRKIYTHTGTCLYPDYHYVARKWDDKGDKCSFVSEVRHLVSGDYSKTFVSKDLKKNPRICYDAFDWPAMGGVLRNGEPLQDLSQYECDVSERLNPFLLRYKNDAPLQFDVDSKTTLDPGGDCHMGRVAYMSDEAWMNINQKYELCVTIDTNVSHITILCNGYKCDGECSLYEKLSLHSKKIYLRKKRRKNPSEILWKGAAKRECHQCDSGNIDYKMSNKPEVSYGLYKRFPAIAQLKREISNAIQKSNALKNPDFSEWDSNFILNLWKFPHRLTLNPASTSQTVHEIQESVKNLKSKLIYDTRLWSQSQWVYQSGSTRLGNIPKQTWRQNKVKACDESLRFQTRNLNSDDLVKGIDICTLTGSLKNLCNRLIDLKNRIAEANCLGSGDSCEVLKMYYNPSEWSISNQNFVRESVRNFYLYKHESSCYQTEFDDPKQREKSQEIASSIFNTNRRQTCSVYSYQQGNDAIDLLRVAMRKMLLAAYDLTMIVANSFIMLFQAIWNQNTAQTREQIIFHFNHLIQMIKEALQEMGNLVVMMAVNLVPFSKVLLDIFEIMCKITKFFMEIIWNPVLCPVFKRVVVVALQLVIMIIDAIRFLVRVNIPSEFTRIVNEMIVQISKMECNIKLNCNFEWNVEESMQATAFLASRCWANPVSTFTSLPIGSSYLGCSGADTCMKDGFDTDASNLILCESCPAVEGFNIEYINRYGCDVLSKRCKCATPVFSPNKCVQNNDCQSRESSCQLMIDQTSPSYATLNCATDCGGSLSAPMCYYDGTKTFGTCTCMTRNVPLQTCTQTGHVALPTLSGMCLFEPNSAILGNQPALNVLDWQYNFLALTPCIQLNNAGDSQLCKRVQFPLNVVQYVIVGFELLSLNVNAARRRLLQWGNDISENDWFTDSMHYNMMHYTETWELAGEPCASLAKEYILLGKEIGSVVDKTTLQTCVFWKTVVNETMNMYNISDTIKSVGGNDLLLVSLAGFWNNVQNSEIVMTWAQNIDAILYALTQSKLFQDIFMKFKNLYSIVDIKKIEKMKLRFQEAEEIFRAAASNITNHTNATNVSRTQRYVHPLFLLHRLEHKILPFSEVVYKNNTMGPYSLNETSVEDHTSVPSYNIPSHEIDLKRLSHTRNLLQQTIQSANVDTQTGGNVYTTDANAFVNQYSLTWQALKNVIFTSWSEDEGGYCKSGTAYSKLLVSAWEDTKTFYERGIPLRNNSKFDISANLRKFPPLDDTIQQKIKSTQDNIENQQNPDLITSALIWLSKLINSAIGFDIIGGVSFFTPSQELNPNNDYLTFQNFLSEMASCDFNRIQNCPNDRKNLLSSTVIVVLFVIVLISFASSFLSFYIVPAVLLVSFIPIIILWYVYSVSPFCFPMLPTCLLRDFNDDFVAAFPSTLVFPLSIIRNKTACNASGVPLNLEDCSGDPDCSARNFDRIYETECFYKCTDNPFAFRGWQDTLAWYMCDLDPTNCESIAKNTFGPLYFFNGVIDSTKRFAEVRKSATVDTQEGYRICSFITAIFLFPGFFFFIWLAIMSFYIIYFIFKLIANVIMYIVQISFVNKRMLLSQDETSNNMQKKKITKKTQDSKQEEETLLQEKENNEMLVYSRRQVEKNIIRNVY